MKSNGQGAGGKGQESGARDPQPASCKKGFTLVELLLSMVISVMVFAAMGSLLVKTMRLWCEGAGQFYLANQARGARARLLSGGMGAGTGFLSISAIKSIKTNPNWCTLDYDVAARDEKFTIIGSVDNDAPANKSIFIKGSKGLGQEWMMVGVKRGQQNLPDVWAGWFDAVQSNRILNVRYRLSYTVGGKTFEYPQMIQAYLINDRGEDDD
jgi:prepilin-type N-terminal cleavage/methylation domain-containing protein